MVNNDNRARQFLPFDSLKGFKDAIKEKQRVVVSRKELTEDSFENLSYKFNQIATGTIITVIHYDKNEYIKTIGFVSKIDLNNRYLMIVDNKIKFDNIYDIHADYIVNIDEEL